MVEWVWSRYGSARGLPLTASICSPQRIMPALTPVPTDSRKLWLQSAGMVLTVCLTPAPKKVFEEARCAALGQSSGEKTAVGSAGSLASYTTSGAPPWCDSRYEATSHLTIAGKTPW